MEGSDSLVVTRAAASSNDGSNDVGGHSSATEAIKVNSDLLLFIC